MLTKSIIEGVVWPGLPDSQGAALSALMFQLERSQFHAPEELFDHQRHQLGSMFLHAQRTVPFYKQRFAEAGFDPESEITPETIRRLPPLTRTEFQEAGDGTTTTKLPRGHGKPFRIKTSGTTGRPVVLYKTPLMQLLWRACALRGHLWHKRDPRLKLAVIRYMEKPTGMAPDGVECEGWGGEAESLYLKTGPMVILNIASRLQDQADWLVRQDPDYILSYPSNLLSLAEYFENNGLTLPRLRQVCTMSELVTPHIRQACRRTWGVSTADIYTCEETGYLAIQCPDHDHYHVQSENVYLELVNEAGEPSAVGASGRVLITSLHNFATPLIRYEVGDYAEWGDPCPCGRGLPVLTRILGRARNRMILPDGRSEFPYFGEYHEYAAISTAVRQYQFVQRSLEEIEKKMVVSEPLTPEQEEKTKELIIRSLGHPFRVTLSYHDEIPRSASGKFEEFVCEVQQ